MIIVQQIVKVSLLVEKVTRWSSLDNYLRQRDNVFAFVCLSVCQQDNSKKLSTTFDEFLGRVEWVTSSK